MLHITLQYEDGGEEKKEPIPTSHHLQYTITSIRTISGLTIDIEPDGIKPERDNNEGGSESRDAEDEPQPTKRTSISKTKKETVAHEQSHDTSNT
jgi:hypothetical protein